MGNSGLLPFISLRGVHVGSRLALLLESGVNHLVLAVEIAPQTRGGLGVMELEWFRDGCAHVLLSLHLLKVLLELLLESLEVRDWLCLGGLEGEQFIDRLGSFLSEISCLFLDLLFDIMLLHARWES